MKNNIYDLLISELIVNSASGGLTSSTSGPTRLEISSTNNSPSVATPFNGNITFTSNVQNIPVGYSIQANSHVLSYPATTPDISSNASLTGAATNVVLGTNGATFVVTSTVTLVKPSNPNIVLNATYTLTAVAPLYFGFKAYSPTPATSTLYSQAHTEHDILFLATSLGRLYVVLPAGLYTFSGLTDDGGQFWPASDFTLITTGGLEYYQLKWDTQLTGTNVKIFKLILS